MKKSRDADLLTKARRQTLKAQKRYRKAVAKGEREVRDARALADARTTRARAEFEIHASNLVELESKAGTAEASTNGAKKAGKARTAAVPSESTDGGKAHAGDAAETELVKVPRPSRAAEQVSFVPTRDAKGRFTKA